MDLQAAYAELGLSRPADEATVKAAWRRLASQWHPDRNPSQQAVRRMQRINHAFEQIRAAGFAAPPGAASASPAPAPAGASARAASGASGSASTGASGQAAGSAAGRASAGGSTEAPAAPPTAGRRSRAQAGAEAAGGHRQGQAHTGADEGEAPTAAAPARLVQRKLKLTLEEAALGCTRSLSGRFTARCGACEGRGHQVRLGSDCPDCAGSGRQRAAGWFGLFAAAAASSTPCEACAGTGQQRLACPACEGSGQLPPQAWRLTVRIPPGVRAGDELSVSSPPPRDGRAAVQLALSITLAPHPLFTLADDGTLHGQVPVDGFSWLGERTVAVPTLDGLQPLTLRREQRVYRLPGRGFPVARRGARGDAVVEVLPVFPDHFSDDQQLLLDQLIATMRPTPGPVGPGAAAGRLRPGQSPRLAEWQRLLAAWQRQRPAG